MKIRVGITYKGLVDNYSEISKSHFKVAEQRPPLEEGVTERLVRPNFDLHWRYIGMKVYDWIGDAFVGYEELSIGELETLVKEQKPSQLEMFTDENFEDRSNQPDLL